jgi:hypothetical protein
MRRACLLAIAALLSLPGSARADDETLTIGMYAPATPFASSTAARAWLEELARAVGKETDRRVTFRVHFRYADLVRAKPHIAVIDARCVVAKKPGKVFAMAVVRNGVHQGWGLWGPKGSSVKKLKGAKVAHDTTDCRDRDVLAHNILASELPLSYFGALISTKTPELAADAVGKSASAAFLPDELARSRGLEQLFDGDHLPTPALVIMRPLDSKTERGLEKAVTGFRSKRLIRRFVSGGRSRYSALAARMKKRRKQPALAGPGHYRLPAADMVEVGGKPADRPGVAHQIQ